MKLCYIIMAHSNLDFVEQQISLLDGNEIGFIVHIDSKCTQDFTMISKIKSVKLAEKRFDIQWGDISMVEAVIALSSQALNDERKFDYFILLSGQCLPVKNPEYIKNYIVRHELCNFITGIPIPSHKCSWSEGGRRRLECYAVRLSPRDIASIEPRKFNIGNLRQFGKILFHGSKKSFMEALKIFFHQKKRKFPNDLQPYGGEFWWRLNYNTLKTVVDYYNNH